ncbi:inositol monophosphatase family protein [Lentilactobacillus laojiaonis]|uniref:inositol monophosphatase family protein n=1 Tax=Lentilactobacillus laojiaonis TaxID=2883998 RepID=UPI001D0B4EFC|nr:inositol monophosphatase family protein [Lentilactobacillus laojiaonis]UDM32504.1 inositol monophosphatase family protein [Lentilactobacillus laojiaonis]
MDLKLVDVEVKKWLKEARSNVLSQMHQKIVVNTKTSNKDLVTNIDKQNENFLVNKIREFDPDAKIMGEEGFGDHVTSLDGHVWIVDPIDGTMNFVKQGNHFAMMISLYIDGNAELGYIYNVMKDELISGGRSIGVFNNDKLLAPPVDTHLSEGLVGLSGPLVLNDVFKMQAIAKQSLGMRIYGSAGLDIISVIKGELVGYISYLKPWDIAAGLACGQPLGLIITNIDGEPIDMISSNLVLISTKNTHRDILSILKG